MWTPESRALVGDFGAGQALSDEQYALLAPQIPPAKPDGRLRATDMRRLLFRVLRVRRGGVGGRRVNIRRRHVIRIPRQIARRHWACRIAVRTGCHQPDAELGECPIERLAADRRHGRDPLASRHCSSIRGPPPRQSTRSARLAAFTVARATPKKLEHQPARVQRPSPRQSLQRRAPAPLPATESPGALVRLVFFNRGKGRNSGGDVVACPTLNFLSRLSRKLSLWSHVMAGIGDLVPSRKQAHIHRRLRTYDDFSRTVRRELQVDAYSRKANVASLVFEPSLAELRQ